MKKLIIFDFDGVICDSLEDLLNSANATLAELGLPSRATQSTIEKMDRVDFTQFAAELGVSARSREAFISSVHKHMALCDLQPFPNIAELLSQLREHYLLINTGSTEEFVSSFLRKSKLAVYFRDIMGRDTGGSKSQRIAHAMDMTRTRKENTFMIGDTVSDILSANVAGTKSVAVTWGFQSKTRLMESHPDFIVDDPLEILKLVSYERNIP